MKYLENLAELWNHTTDEIKNIIDEGMVDIIYVLNAKNYVTCVCCEGHLRENNIWNGYIGFIYPYDFSIYPPNFSQVRNKRKYYYWNGEGEESRQEFLKEVLAWAEMLPTHNPVYKYYYSLVGYNKRSHNKKIFITSENYEDVKCLMNRKDMNKYDLTVETFMKRLDH